MEGNEPYPMYRWASDLFPVCRSLTGEGVRKTLSYFKTLLPQLKIEGVPTGYKAFDWTVPEEWAIEDAYVLDPGGDKIIDFHDSNLHVVGYSASVDTELTLDALESHLYSVAESPGAIPYVTSYYEKNWGFCLAHKKRRALEPGLYRAVIKSRHFNGELNYGELVIPGKSTREVLISTYVCHPSLANNELSGPVVAAALGQWLADRTDRQLTYRIIFVPESIGSIVYLSKHLKALKKNMVAGFVVTCVGDDGRFSYLPSRLGGTLADRVAVHVLSNMTAGYNTYSFARDRGSDEKHYCSPHVDLPVVSFSRSKAGTYPEYHTSLDNLDLISQKNLEQSLAVLQNCIRVLENNRIWTAVFPCEPQLGKRNLYENISFWGPGRKKPLFRIYTDILAYADGNHTLLDIAEKIDVPAWECAGLADTLYREGLLSAGLNAEHPCTGLKSHV